MSAPARQALIWKMANAMESKYFIVGNHTMTMSTSGGRWFTGMYRLSKDAREAATLATKGLERDEGMTLVAGPIVQPLTKGEEVALNRGEPLAETLERCQTMLTILHDLTLPAE